MWNEYLSQEGRPIKEIMKTKGMSSASAWSQGAPEYKLQRKSLSHLEVKELGFRSPESVTGNWRLQEL